MLSLKTFLSDAMLPLPASALWTEHVLLWRPHAFEFDWRRTSYKKLSKFLAAFAKRGILKCKEVKGTLLVMQVDRMHPDLAWLAPRPEHLETRALNVKQREKNERREQEARDADKKGAFGADPIVVIEALRAPPHFAELFGDEPDGRYFTATEARKVLTDYIQKTGCTDPQNKSMIVLDAVLCDSLLKAPMKKGELKQYPDKIKKEQAFVYLLDAMVRYHAVCPANAPIENPHWRKGAPPTVAIAIEKRQGRKMVTLVSNLEAFGIDPERFAQDAQRKFACAATTQALGMGKDARHVEVLMQGSFGDELSELLTAVFGIPARSISVKDNSGK
jgi:translation initiation factor 2D